MEIIRGKIAKAQKIVLYGPEGIGKSTFASQFPEPLFIDTEGSTNNMDVARLSKPSSWELLNQQIEYVKQNRPCKSLIIDTIDWAERLGIEFITNRGGKKSITNFGYGEGFIQLEEEFGKLLNKLSDVVDVGIHVVLTAHAKITRFEQPDEIGAYDRWELKLGNKTTAKTAALVKEWADMILFANYDIQVINIDNQGAQKGKNKAQGGKRVMYSTHTPSWDAKNRHNLDAKLDFAYKEIEHCITYSKENIQSQKDLINGSENKVSEKIDSMPEVEKSKASTSAKENNPINEVRGETSSIIPKALSDLMQVKSVTEEEIREVVAQRGYYPEDTPIENYDSNFIAGVLVGAWEQVFKMIIENRLNKGQAVDIEDYPDDMPFK